MLLNMVSIFLNYDWKFYKKIKDFMFLMNRIKFILCMSIYLFIEYIGDILMISKVYLNVDFFLLVFLRKWESYWVFFVYF